MKTRRPRHVTSPAIDLNIHHTDCENDATSMSAARVLRKRRSTKDSTFLDDPSQYPEFDVLMTKLATIHRMRCTFHVHRTAALTTLLAVSVSLRGTPSPSVKDGSLEEWLHYLSVGIGIDLLRAHFAGFPSALACMAVIATLAVLVYPLHAFLTMIGGRRLPGWGATVAVVIPACSVWGFALWVKDVCTWGVASGLWFGLFCACVTLKIISYAAECTPERAQQQQQEGEGNSKTLLTFGEYFFFLFLSPALSCEAHLMKASARRASRPLRAASEFLHAALTFLALHSLASSAVAPSMRVLTAGLMPQSFADVALWMELDVAGKGGWPSWRAASVLLEGGTAAAWLATVGALLWLVVICTSAVHFLAFYAFWHCVCLGMVELWGFPDSHLYGPWWLVFDDPRDFIRMWSVPVHRWLSSSVHWPVLGAAAARSARSEKNQNGNGDNTTTSNDSDGEALLKGVGRREIKRRAPPGWTLAVLSVFVVSMVFHEVIVYVAMRGTCWPLNTFLLTVAGTFILFWDVAFPLLVEDGGGESLAGSVVSGGGGGGDDDAVGVAGEAGVATVSNNRNAGEDGGIVKAGRFVNAFGARGLAAAVAFTVAVQISGFIADYSGWLWWRCVLLHG